jgi:hypothetical protein
VVELYQLTILQLEDFLPTSLFPNLLPQPIGGFINNIFRGLTVTTKTKLILKVDGNEKRGGSGRRQ